MKFNALLYNKTKDGVNLFKDRKRKTVIYLLLLLIIGLSSLQASAQTQTQYYEQFIKIWGVLKYKTNLKNNDPCYWNSVFIESVSEIPKIG